MEITIQEIPTVTLKLFLRYKNYEIELDLKNYLAIFLMQEMCGLLVERKLSK